MDLRRHGICHLPKEVEIKVKDEVACPYSLTSFCGYQPYPYFRTYAFSDRDSGTFEWIWIWISEPGQCGLAQESDISSSST
jgi:hypothetical protein